MMLREINPQQFLAVFTHLLSYDEIIFTSQNRNNMQEKDGY